MGKSDFYGLLFLVGDDVIKCLACFAYGREIEALRGGGWVNDLIRIGIALVILVDTNIIQVVVESFDEPFHWHTTIRKRPHPIHPFPYFGKMLAMIKRIRQTFGIIIIVIAYCIDDSVIRNANVICRQRIKTRNILKSRKIIAIACTDHITIWVELHIPNSQPFKCNKFPVLHI